MCLTTRLYGIYVHVIPVMLHTLTDTYYADNKSNRYIVTVTFTNSGDIIWTKFGGYMLDITSLV